MGDDHVNMIVMRDAVAVSLNLLMYTGANVSKPKRQAFYPTDAAQLPAALMNTATPRGSIGKTPPPALKAQTTNQKSYLKKLKHGSHDILLAIGPAGSGKTYMAMRTAIEQYMAGDFDKIIITRPTVSSGEEDYGYLPGSLIEKLSPWCIPLLDIAKEVFTPQQVERMLIAEEIEIAPLGFMRGRTLKNAIVIVDEAQNCSPDQLRMVMTRLGDNSRMVITGDLEQVDLDDRTRGSGLADFVRRLENRAQTASLLTTIDRLDETYRSDRIGLIKLGRADVVRHPVIDDILNLYEQAD